MEFIRVKKFFHNDFNVKKSKFKDETILSLTCYYFSREDQIISVGLTNGKILEFHKKGFDTKFVTEKKEYEIVEYEQVQNCHKGEVKCIISYKLFNNRYILTGSVDRTVKIWDTDPKKKAIVQTLVGHQGTIIAIEYSKKNETLFTASNDKTFKIWKQEEGRELFYHPWFVCYQVIFDFSMKKMTNNSTYISCIHCKDGENLQLYAGDTEGSLHMIRPESLKKNSVYILEKSNYNYHRLHVIQVISVAKDNQLFSIGYDQKIYGFEELAGKQFFNYKNPHKCLFTSICWNTSHSELIAADEQGRIYFINVHTDKAIQEFALYQQKILKIEIIEHSQSLMIATSNFIDILRIKRGLKAGNVSEAHTGPIIDLYALIPFKLTQKKYKESPKLISASLDNTIRVWDPKDMQCQNLLENPDKHEISCLSYLSQANLFVTGHENGDIKLWNIELNNYLTLDQQPPHKHKDSIQCFTSYVQVEQKGQQVEKTEYLFSSGYDGKINVWEIFEKKSFVQNSIMGSTICPQLKYSIQVDPFTEHRPGKFEILCMAFDTKEENIIAGGNSGHLYYIKMFTYETKHIEQYAHADSINVLVVEERILFSGSDEKVIKLWDLDSKQHLNTLDHFNHNIKDMLIIQETGHLVSCSFDGKIFVWDYPHSSCVGKFDKTENLRCITYVYDEKEMNNSGIIKKELTLYVGTDDNNIYSFQLDHFLDSKIISDQDNIRDLFKKLENNQEKADKIQEKDKRNQTEQEIVDNIVEQQRKLLKELQKDD
ncbi:hypothetical protein ABPG74_018824 [Tetrahymena malaccensis]